MTDNNISVRPFKLFDGLEYVLDKSAEPKEGTKACVYKVKRLADDHFFALKVLNNKWDSKEQKDVVTEDLLLEGEHASELYHRNIVSVYGSGQINAQSVNAAAPNTETAYVLMDWCEGKTLDQWLSNRDRLSVSDAYNLFAQLTDAFTYLSNRGWFYQDIKKTNIMMVDEKPMIIDLSSVIWIKDKKVAYLPYYTDDNAPLEMLGDDDFVPSSSSVSYALGVLFLSILCPVRGFMHYKAWEHFQGQEKNLPVYLRGYYRLFMQMVAQEAEDRIKLQSVYLQMFSMYNQKTDLIKNANFGRSVPRFKDNQFMVIVVICFAMMMMLPSFLQLNVPRAGYVTVTIALAFCYVLNKIEAMYSKN